jgi:ubiquinone/menaquinone biosynthesis C-methylase UbiE
MENQNMPSKETNIPKQVQSAYDQIVSTYADQNHSPLPPENLRRWADELVKHVGREGRLLEVGCGTGRDMAWFESQQIRVVGLDLSAGMLNYARSQVSGGLVMMSMQQIGFADDHFDGIWCCASLLHLPKSQVPDILQEIGRVLKGGGLMVLSVQAGQFEGWDEGYVDGVKRFFARYRREEMADLLAGAGFEVREIEVNEAGKRTWLAYLCQYEGKSR